MLKHIPLISDYYEARDFVLNYYEGQLAHSVNNAHGIVLWLYDDEFFEEERTECGMEMFVVLLCSALFEINHSALEYSTASEAAEAIAEFETGRFDDLFTADELAAINADITTVKEYLAAHPELLED